MPKFLNRSTRQLVWQYGNELAAGANFERKDAAPKAFAALEKLLDACVEAEANAARGRIPMVTVHWIRKTITESLNADG